MDRKQIGLLTGIILLVACVLAPTPEGMNPNGMKAAGVASLMAIWWVTEAIPIYATAFVPMVLFPLLGVLNSAATAKNYAHNFVLMLLGGLIIAKAIEAQNLHKRIALLTIRTFGTDRSRIILSFMIATAFLSMWLANIAVTLMMLPIAMAVVQKEETGKETDNFGLALMLALAYSASIGGMGTIVGTPPNLVFAGMVEKLYPSAPDITFTDWIVIGFPLVAVLIPIAWVYLTRYFSIDGKLEGSLNLIKNELHEMGAMSKGEKRVLFVFVLTALGWIFRKDLNFGAVKITGWASLLGVDEYVHDATVAMLGVILLFIIPSGKKDKTGRNAALLTWREAEQVPWGVVMIIGGGYALAAGFEATDLATWIGQKITFLREMPTFLVLFLIVLTLTFLTEINSNTATATIFLPVLAATAVANAAHPFLMMIPATFACSCAFMLPSGTGTNAIVFASNRVTIPKMAKAGFGLNLIAIGIITLVAYLVLVPYFGLEEIPTWAI